MDKGPIFRWVTDICKHMNVLEEKHGQAKHEAEVRECGNMHTPKQRQHTREALDRGRHSRCRPTAHTTFERECAARCRVRVCAAGNVAAHSRGERRRPHSACAGKHTRGHGWDVASCRRGAGMIEAGGIQGKTREIGSGVT